MRVRVHEAGQDHPAAGVYDPLGGNVGQHLRRRPHGGDAAFPHGQRAILDDGYTGHSGAAPGAVPAGQSEQLRGVGDDQISMHVFLIRKLHKLLSPDCQECGEDLG